MAGLGDLILDLVSLCGWRAKLFDRRRTEKVLELVRQLNEIDIEGQRVYESEKVDHAGLDRRARVPSDEELWRKERAEGVERAYW